MIEAVLSIKAPDWISDLSEKHSARIRVLGCVPFAKGGVKDLIEITAPEDNMVKVIGEIKGYSHLKDVDIATTKKDRALASVSTEKCSVCSTLAGSDCFLVSANLKNGKIEWTLLSSDKRPIRELIKNMRKNGLEVEIVKMVDIKTREALTNRQEEIIQIALEKGYFDYPKRTSIRELASIFGVSISTLSEILRHGQKKILKSYFSERKMS